MRSVLFLTLFVFPLALGGNAFSASSQTATSPSVKAPIIVGNSAANTSGGVEDPVSIIRRKDQEMQKLLRDKNANQKTGQLKVLINGIFDFEELGKRALGNKTWGTITPEQQKRFVAAFKGMVENSSVKKLEAYQSDSTAYDKPEIDGDRTNVTAHVFNKGQESIVVYKLLQKEGTWKAWDLVIDDLSTSANYGEQFRKILQSGTIDGLIAKLEKKAAGDESKADNVKSASEKKTVPKTKVK
jgi:phospholipid transport system substrate-binding protein